MKRVYKEHLTAERFKKEKLDPKFIQDSESKQNLLFRNLVGDFDNLLSEKVQLWFFKNVFIRKESAVFGKNLHLFCFPYLPLIITVSPVYHLYAKVGRNRTQFLIAPPAGGRMFGPPGLVSQ